MMNLSIREQWCAEADKGLKSPEGYAYVLEHYPVRLEEGRPGFAAYVELGTALEIGFAYPDHEMVRAYARRSFEYASHGVQEPVGQQTVDERDRFEARQCKCYAAAMLGLAPLDTSLLIGAAEDLLIWMEDGMVETGWDGCAQSECLEAASLFLLAAEVQKASGLLSSKRRFSHHLPWKKGLEAIAPVVERGAGGFLPGTSEVAPFEALFQQLRPFRQPDWLHDKTVSVNILRLEICLLRYLYVTHPGEPIVWNRVLEQVGDDAV
ncbi:hypothetical protein [Nevskia soli]|uniref:hypothetical protein n=1 Tax=Nevskia soli TaxID=418856 RepID=UPI0004A6B991|nr:hypothetical protein [Nevskia soli]